MTRPLRVWAPGIAFHIISRGNNRDNIFRDDQDRQAFIKHFGRVSTRRHWRCYAYCLMDNHFHLVIESPKPTISNGMRQLNSTYARRFNQRHQRSGHLFEKRYRAIAVEAESYLAEVCRYVVLNPVRAGLVTHPTNWAWSSYNGTVGLSNDPFVNPALVLSHFSDQNRIARQRYREYVLRSDCDVLSAVRGERLGSEHFLTQGIGEPNANTEHPLDQRHSQRRSLADIFSTEQAPISVAYRDNGYRLNQISNFLCCHYSTVSRKLTFEEEGVASSNSSKDKQYTKTAP